MFLYKKNKIPNWVLEGRVRTELGRLVSEPRKLGMKAEAGVIRLRGSIPKNEAATLIARVKAIPGVSRVVCEWSDGPALREGRPALREGRPGALAKLPPPAASFLLGLGSGALAFSGAGLIAHGLTARFAGARK